MDLDENGSANGNGVAADPVETARRKTVDAITGAADGLYARGQHEIYEAERELLMRQYRRETGEDWKAPSANAPGGDADAVERHSPDHEARQSTAQHRACAEKFRGSLPDSYGSQAPEYAKSLHRPVE